MPFTLLSHQTPALALKIKYPRKFDGIALCFGTIFPDLNFIFDFFFRFNFYAFTHSLVGQILWTIPLAIISTIIFSKYLGSLFAKMASQKSKIFELFRYFGVDQWIYLKDKKFTRQQWVIITYSALIGGILHILLDWLSHGNVYILYPWIYGPNFEFLSYSIVNFGIIAIGPLEFEANLTIYNLLWYLESIFGLVISLYFLRIIKKKDLILMWYQAI